jgi:hypothetical protein
MPLFYIPPHPQEENCIFLENLLIYPYNVSLMPLPPKRARIGNTVIQDFGNSEVQHKDDLQGIAYRPGFVKIDELAVKLKWSNTQKPRHVSEHAHT